AAIPGRQSCPPAKPLLHHDSLQLIGALRRPERGIIAVPPLAVFRGAFFVAYPRSIMYDFVLSEDAWPRPATQGSRSHRDSVLHPNGFSWEGCAYGRSRVTPYAAIAASVRHATPH